MTNKLFGETGSRKRKIWTGVGIFTALMFIYQVGYSAGVLSATATLEQQAAVPVNRPGSTPESALRHNVALPPVPSFSSLSPLTGRVQPPGGGTAMTRPAEPCRCGKVH